MLCERLQTLAQAGYSTAQITAALAQEGFHSPKQGTPFSRQSVHELMRRLGVHQPRRRRRLPLSEHEWWLSDLERVFGRSELDAASVAEVRLAASPLASAVQAVGGVGG